MMTRELAQVESPATAYAAYRRETLAAIAEGADHLDLVGPEQFEHDQEQLAREWPATDHAQRRAYRESHEGCAGC